MQVLFEMGADAALEWPAGTERHVHLGVRSLPTFFANRDELIFDEEIRFVRYHEGLVVAAPLRRTISRGKRPHVVARAEQLAEALDKELGVIALTAPIHRIFSAPQGDMSARAFAYALLEEAVLHQLAIREPSGLVALRLFVKATTVDEHRPLLDKVEDYLRSTSEKQAPSEFLLALGSLIDHLNAHHPHLAVADRWMQAVAKARHREVSV